MHGAIPEVEPHPGLAVPIRHFGAQDVLELLAGWLRGKSS